MKIVKYNKSIQNLFEINIIDYITSSGKYIEYESNGKVKEFCIYDDHLLFEGEYLIGKRNGKGKEYYENGDLKFEGEYLNGKRNEKEKYILKQMNCNLEKNI